MKAVRFLIFAATVLACGILPLGRNAFAQTKPIPSGALSGEVTSMEEGPMEGVLVTVKKDDSTISITVSSNAQGRYVFPTSKIGAGRYSIRKFERRDTIWEGRQRWTFRQRATRKRT